MFPWHCGALLGHGRGNFHVCMCSSITKQTKKQKPKRSLWAQLCLGVLHLETGSYQQKKDSDYCNIETLCCIALGTKGCIRSCSVGVKLLVWCGSMTLKFFNDKVFALDEYFKKDRAKRTNKVHCETLNMLFFIYYFLHVLACSEWWCHRKNIIQNSFYGYLF